LFGHLSDHKTPRTNIVLMPLFSTSTRRGAALIEYGLLVGLVAVVAIGSVSTLGEEIDGTFANVTAELSSNTAGASTEAPARTPVAMAHGT
jgi:pilus assembly protein Flp/PilA